VWGGGGGLRGGKEGGGKMREIGGCVRRWWHYIGIKATLRGAPKVVALEGGCASRLLPPSLSRSLSSMLSLLSRCLCRKILSL